MRFIPPQSRANRLLFKALKSAGLLEPEPDRPLVEPTVLHPMGPDGWRKVGRGEVKRFKVEGWKKSEPKGDTGIQIVLGKPGNPENEWGDE